MQLCGIKVYGSQSEAVLETLPGIARAVDVDDLGTAYVVDTDGRLFKKLSSNSMFVPIGSHKSGNMNTASEIAVGPLGKVFKVSFD